MFETSLTIENPYGLSVFGSALLKVSPDSALVNASVTRVEQRPSDSFSKAKEGARAVADFLRRSKIDEFGTSRISLIREIRFVGNEQRFLGYKATVDFTVRITALDRLEEVVTGVVEAGANEIASIRFHTSALKDLRAQARRLAIEAAKEKAAIYASAAGVRLGGIIHIQDVNPQVLQQSERFRGHGQGQPLQELIDHDGDKQTLDPSAIEVTAAALVAFSLEQSSN
jgi:uncharacterized protein YggE